MSNDPIALELNHARQNRLQAVKAGAIPTTSEFFTGFPFVHANPERDFQLWTADGIDSEIQDVSGDGQLDRAAERAARRFTLPNLLKLSALAEKMALGEIAQRVLWYRCSLCDLEARHRLVAMAMAMAARDTANAPYTLAVSLGLAGGARNGADALAAGEKRRIGIEKMHQRLVQVSNAEEDEWVQRALEDRAEIEPSDDLEYDEPAMQAGLQKLVDIGRAKAEGVVVVPTLNLATMSKHRREIALPWQGIAGTRLPLVKIPNLVEARRQLMQRGEHLRSAIDVLLRDTMSSQHVRIRPTILLGPSGAGKSALATAFGEAMGVPTKLIDLGGVADSSVGGTSSQWASARENSVVQFIREKRVANPLFIFDEVDKASADRRNGSVFDALLVLLERDQARTFHDPALEVSCDLSCVNYVLTANIISDVPTPLRDRCRIIKVSEPQWEHIAPIVERMIVDIAKQRELDRRWFDPLAQDEMSLIHHAWQSGSLRQLQRIVETILDGRDSIIGRC